MNKLNLLTARLKQWARTVGGELPGMKGRIVPVVRRISGVLGVCALLLTALCMLEGASASLAWPMGSSTLISLIGSLIALPVAAGMITYAAAASWEGRSASLNDAVQLARIRIRQIVITGVAAGVIMMLAGWIASAASSLIAVVQVVLGWIPLLGPVISGIAALIIWLIALLTEFAAHVALVMGMLALTADGVSGRPQLDRVLSIIKGGRSSALTQLAAVFLLWIAVYGLHELAVWTLPLGGILGSCILTGALTAFSMAAVSTIYLQERDRQDGMRYHA